jgi:hypothetical protein
MVEIDSIKMLKEEGEGYPLNFWRTPDPERLDTNYEKRNGIRQGERLILEEFNDIIFVSKQKDDGSKTFMIVFRVGKDMDRWLAWVPTKEQACIMRDHFSRLYFKIDDENKIVKAK